MSLSVVGVWAVGVWDTTVWADGVWREGDGSPAPEPARIKGGSSGDSPADARARRLKLQEARKQARFAALKKSDELFESIFGEDEEVEGVKIEGLPKMPAFEHLNEIATIKDKVVRNIAAIVRHNEIVAYNAKVVAYEEGLRELEAELVAVLVLTEDEDVGTITLNH